MLIHPGRLTHFHEGLATTQGTRYILISFVNANLNRTCYQSKGKHYCTGWREEDPNEKKENDTPYREE
jgi:hypothetical protein